MAEKQHGARDSAHLVGPQVTSYWQMSIDCGNKSVVQAHILYIDYRVAMFIVPTKSILGFTNLKIIHKEDSQDRYTHRHHNGTSGMKSPIISASQDSVDRRYRMIRLSTANRLAPASGPQHTAHNGDHESEATDNARDSVHICVVSSQSIELSSPGRYHSQGAAEAILHSLQYLTRDVATANHCVDADMLQIKRHAFHRSTKYVDRESTKWEGDTQSIEEDGDVEPYQAANWRECAGKQCLTSPCF